MSLKFGVLLPQGWTMDLARIKNPIQAYETMTTIAQTADELGFASAWLVDHFHTTPYPSQEITFECWTCTAALARDTRNIRIGQMVTCNSYRHPALLAKMASTVNALSHGRLNFGIGAGWYEHEYRAYGYAYPDAPERLRQLREAVKLIQAIWKEEETRHVHSQTGDINENMKPRIPLLIGGSGEKVTLKLVAQYADACNVGDNPITMKQKFDVLKQHCAAVGRDYESIHRTSTTLCLIADSDEEALALLPVERKATLGDRIHTTLIGSPETIRQRLAAYEEAGVQELLMRFINGTDLEALRRFAKEFLP
ncbi:LLM class F420-dependent oxidoreductase [Reticulibacter mediterranei]|uniref:LLM class F420-dependent oxidoreductase n=1 Tax=Reticulibacter mediterranei TaxID=2778369 RepID=A0A8J3IE66_9CHLR|nr:TIGR03560 family F420-dependent LLM class oxidoreductase [Reticulibacter mediterranei]GHO90830.1 LLM class F420-dependent oxidoreductase [Reticulibacter mediterranei]